MKIAGCVPAYNNESTIAQAVASLRAQTIPLADIFVIDDGSRDATAQRAQEAGARVVSLSTNQGRGAARARAILETDAELLVSVDGTAALRADFLERCKCKFDDPAVAAVYGKITQADGTRAVDRWRGRHLYRIPESEPGGEVSNLITWGFVQRREAVLAVGNYDESCRHSEDAELGHRLVASGFKIIYEPQAVVTTLVSNSLSQVFERFWRWNQAASKKPTIGESMKFGWYAIKVMARKDLHAGDFAGAGITLLLPAYCAWRACRSK